MLLCKIKYTTTLQSDPLKAEKSGKFQIVWERALARKVICIWQKMQRMQEEQQFQGSVEISMETADRPESTER